MKPWIKRTLIGLAAAALLLGGLAACGHRAHHGWNGWHGMSGPMTAEDGARMKARLVDRAGRKLDLDAAQKARLGALADALREQRNALVGTTDPRAELRGLIAGPAFDRDRAQGLITGKTSAISTGSPAVVAAMADFYDSLRPEQQAQLREMMNRRGDRS